ncbi:MAG: phosphatase PAP2 family protein, partial [Coriobacteriales bacterium]|nr:phosphatase PAP2 family protein [Coriobacteriales bacterium]
MELLSALETIRSPILDIIFSYITVLGEETVVITLLCLVYWCADKHSAYLVGLTFFISGLLVQGMKIGFRIDRPWIIDPSLKPVESAIPAATGYSFPSGHTQSAVALFGSMAMRLKRISVKIACIVIIILVAFSRMYLGVHTLLDVGVSLIITALVVVIISKLLSGESVDKKRAQFLAVSVVVCSIIVIVVASLFYSSGTIEQAYLTDCLKAAGASIGFAIGMYIERIYIDFSVKTRGIQWQVVKYAIGITGVLLIKEGLKLVFGTGLVIDTVRYFLISTWVSVFFPL